MAVREWREAPRRPPGCTDRVSEPDVARRLPLDDRADHVLAWTTKSGPSAEVSIAQQIADASHIYANNPVALQIRQMGLIYDMNKDRGVTILVPTGMANALGASIALNVSNPDFPPPAPPDTPFNPRPGSVPQA